MQTTFFTATFNRRDAVKILGATAVGFPLFETLCADLVPAADARQPKNRFARMVHEFFVREVQKAYQQNVQAYAQLQTREDAARYVATVRDKIRECFGPEPERTPLSPRITGVVERDAYRIEKIIFESRPAFPVTANLYVPKDVDLPRPGVVGCCGHSTNGKAEAAYQSFAQGLARLGYVCLIYDPIGQGERLQYVQEDLSSRIGVGVAGTFVRREPAVSGGRVLRHVASLGWHSRAGLPADALRGGSATRGCDRQLGWRHADDLALWSR